MVNLRLKINILWILVGVSLYFIWEGDSPIFDWFSTLAHPTTFLIFKFLNRFWLGRRYGMARVMVTHAPIFALGEIKRCCSRFRNHYLFNRLGSFVPLLSRYRFSDKLRGTRGWGQNCVIIFIFFEWTLSRWVTCSCAWLSAKGHLR